MAGRKLQTEIDRILKKIEEGIQAFDETWDKVKSATTANLKEKYEGDLKKEIKKLQRYRDQVKTWAASNEVKKKAPLLDARKLIESKMEAFKVLEKETKTKAYSKEGLLKINQKRRAIDEPGSAAYEMMEWLRAMWDKINEQKEEYEATLEELRIANPKKKGKDTTDEAEVLAARVEKHGWHLDQLDSIKDKLEENENLVPKIEEIKDGVNYYFDSHQDPDFVDDDALYEGIEEAANAQRLDAAAMSDLEHEDEKVDDDDLDKSDSDSGADDADSATPAATPTPAAVAPKAPAPKKDDAKETKRAAPAAAPTPAPAATPAAVTASASSTPATAAGKKPAQPATAAAAASTGPSSANATPVTANAKTPTVVVPAAASAAAPTAAALAGKGKAAPATVAPAPSAAVAANASASAASVSSSSSAATAAAPTPAPQPSPPAAAAASAKKQETLANIVKKTTAQEQEQAKKAAQAQAAAVPAAVAFPPLSASTASTPTPAVTSNPSAAAVAAGVAAAPSAVVLQPTASGVPAIAARPAKKDDAKPGAKAPGVADGAEAAIARPAFEPPVAITPEYQQALQLLQTSFRNMPLPADTDRPKVYQPRNAKESHPAFPNLPAPHFDDPAMFEKFDLDTLFFIFYFQQGTHHQYLAARQLKKLSWRYHKKYMTWFQRSEEPHQSTDEYEHGAYKHFDYEQWKEQERKNFTFEYQFLEDDLPSQ